MLRQRRRLVVIAAAAVCGVLWLAPSGPAASDSEGTVYVQTNTAPINYVLALDRHHDGTLGPAVRYATLGSGKPAGNPPLGIPFLDSAGSVTLSDDGKLLFVVNAGDNTITSFRVSRRGLELADIIPTFGTRPVSSTSHDDLLYVLNSDTSDGSISGYHVDGDGGLTPIAGSHQPTSQPVGGMPAQIQFDTTGRFLTVSERLAGPKGVIDTYAVGRGGVAGPPTPHPSSDNGPFGIAFTSNDLMIVSNEHFPDVFPPTLLSSTSSYGFARDGTVTPIDTELAHAGGACWNAITKDDKFVFVTSPFTSNINSFGIKPNGDLVPVNGTSVVATTTGLALDEALSHNSRFLYVLDSAGFASSAIDEYAVAKDGTITKIGTSATFEGSAAGAAAW